MKHLILIGACYVDTVLSVPYWPQEDEKLRASQLQIRRGGNCPNSLEVLCQLLESEETAAGRDPPDVQLHLVSPMPARGSPAAELICGSFGDAGRARVGLHHCLFREGHQQPASCYIMRSEATGSRTMFNYIDLPEMTADEFAAVAGAFSPEDDCLFHFEGRIPETTRECMAEIRRVLPSARISIELEKPRREGIEALAAEADVVFYSQAWAESRGHQSAEQCLKKEPKPKAFLGFCTWGARGAAAISLPAGDTYCYPPDGPLPKVRVVDSIGAGDTFIAGVLFGLLCHPRDWDTPRKLSFATRLATLKVQREGFGGLQEEVADLSA